MSVNPGVAKPSAWATAEIMLQVLPPTAAPADPFGRWYAAWANTGPIELRIADERTLTLEFGEALAGAQLVPVPNTSPLVNVFLETSAGLQVNGESRRTLSASGGKLLVTRLSFTVTALLPGTQTVTARIYPGAEVEGAQPPEVTLALTVAAPVDERAQEPDPAPVPWPKPDLLLYVALRPALPASDGKAPRPEQLDVWATCPALLRKTTRYDVPLTAADAASLRQAAARHALAVRRGGEPLERLRRFGMALFDALAPGEDTPSPDLSLAELLVEACRLAGTAPRTLTCLIISDEAVSLPWELVLPYAVRNDLNPPVTEVQDFLALRFALGQWFGRQGWQLAAGVPLRRFQIAHYSQQPGEPEYWQALLGGQTRASTSPTTAGFEVNDPGSYVVGVHLLRYLDRTSRGEIRSAGATGDDLFQTATRDRRLSFAARRPLVTLSLLEETAGLAPALDPIDLEQDYARLFLGAQASAVIGPRWPVAADVDRTFYRLLYDQLYRGRRLGDAVRLARAATAAAHPLTIDWLAYALYGHPGAEPYIVMQAAAYSLFEVLAPDPDEPLAPGETYQFRASYGVEMPPGNRIYFAPKLPDVTSPSVIVMAEHLKAPVLEPLERVGDRLEKTLQIDMPKNRESVTFNVWFMDGPRDLGSQIVSFGLRETN